MARLLLLFGFFLSIGADAAEPAFLNSAQKAVFFKSILSEIARVDAEGVKTRDLVRSTKWQDFVQQQEPKFTQAQDWDDLNQAYMELAYGFVNSHSHFSFYVGQNSFRSAGVSDRPVGYEYPHFRMFDIQTGFDVKAVNGIAVATDFPQKLDLLCPFNSEQACALFYTKGVNSGMLRFAGQIPQTLTLNDGLRDFDVSIHYQPKLEPAKVLYCDQIANDYAGFTRVSSGYNLCLFKKGSVGLIRLRNFIYWQTDDPGYLSMEDEVNRILVALRSHPEIENLIFDLLANGGGNENTPFLKAFVPNQFGELLAAYRKVRELDDSFLRSKVFYDVAAAENWFQELIKSGIYATIPYGEYLPARPYFCQASSVCSAGMIPARSDGFKAKKIALLVDGRCVSSCDDFTWRMKKYAGAYVLGLPQMADATYSRMKISFVLTDAGQITTQSGFQKANARLEPGDTLIADMVIPLTQWVDERGQMMTGRPAALDLQIPLTRANYKIYSSFAVDKAYEFLLLQDVRSGAHP